MESNNQIDEIIESYNSYLTTLKSGVETIHQNIRVGEKETALQMILDFSEGINWIYEVNSKLNMLGYHNKIDFSEIEPLLNEINEGLSIGDFVLVADIFEYEISASIKNLLPFNVQ